METGTKTYISNGFLSHNCEWKFSCWPDLRTFIYSNGPRFLTKVVKEPNTLEIE